MTNFRIGGVAVTLVLLGTLSAQAAPVATQTPLSTDEKRMMNTCLAMATEARLKDAACATMMKAMSLSDADMDTMKSCKSMKPDAMADDSECQALNQKYPSIMAPVARPQ